MFADFEQFLLKQNEFLDLLVAIYSCHLMFIISMNILNYSFQQLSYMGSVLFTLNSDSEELLIFLLGLYLAVSSWFLLRRRFCSQCSEIHKKGFTEDRLR